MNDPHFFQFEAEFIESLHCIPMVVRMKLDTCGVKLKLAHWNKFAKSECQTLVTMPCSTTEEASDYREFLQKLILQKTGTTAKELAIAANPPWLDETAIPENLQEKAKGFDIEITLAQWQKLTALQRFALIKLSTPSHESNNFLPALKEFKITT
ncbi:MAG: nitrate reductase associated protein [Xenococcus sp. (in: cyanobacteria)]